MADVKLIDDKGRVVVADEADATELVSSGLYAPASAEEVQREATRLELSDTGSTLAAGLEGAASGATLGLSDVAIQGGLLGNEFAEESRLRAEYNPKARGIGEAAGILGTTIASGGLGALEQGVARGVARGLGEGALKQALAKGAGAAASGAVEGAVFGAGHELSEAALARELSDPEKLAQRLAVAGGWGALMGAGLSGATAAGVSLAGSGLSAAGRGVKGLFRRGDDALPAGAPGAGLVDDAAAPLAQRAGVGDTRQIIAGATAEDEAVMEALSTPLARRSPDRLHEASQKLDDVQQRSIREMRDSQQEIERLSDANREALSVAEKPEAVRKIIAEGGGPASAVDEQVLRTVGSVSDAVQELAERADDYELGGRSAIKLMARKMESLGARVDEVVSKYRSDPAEQAVQTFRLLDQVKRDLGKAQVAAVRGPNGSQEAMLAIQDLREGLRGFLEDENVWGAGVAGFQRELNQSWAPLLDVDVAFARKFERGSKESFATGKSTYDLTRQLADADTDSIAGMLRSVGRAESEQWEALYRLKLAREVAYQKKAAQLFGDSPEVVQRAQKMQEQARRNLKALDEARQTSLEAAEYAGQQAALEEIPFIGGQLAKGRQSAGKGLSWVRDKFGAAPSVSDDAARRAQEGAGAVRKAAGAILDAAKRSAPRAGRAARAAGTYLGVRMGAELDASRYQQIGERVRELQDPESPARVRARDRTARLREQRPEVADALTAQLMRGAAFLGEKFRSAAPSASDPFNRHREPKMDPRTMQKFLRYVDAVQDPQGALERAGRGELRREDIEVLREVYPRVYEDLVTDVLDRASRSSEMPDYQQRVKLGLLLGVPTDPSMAPDALRSTMESAARLAGVGGPEEQGGGPTVSPSNAKPPEAGAELYDSRAQVRISAR